MKTRPETLTGKTIKIRTGTGNMFVTINELDSKPFEIFITVGKCGGSAQAKAESIGRLCSLALRSDIPVGDIIKQLEDISGEFPVATGDTVIKSIPDAVAKVLKALYAKTHTVE